MAEQLEHIYFYSTIPDRHMYFSPIAPKDKPMSERDIHFMGASELLLQKLEQLRLSRAEQKTLITHFLYDFAAYIHKDAPVTEWEWEVKDIPDMAEWPERSEQ